MDASDGLLLDAARMEIASKVEIRIDLDTIPLSMAYRRMRGDGVDSRLQAASWGDDYQLLFTLPEDVLPSVTATCVGVVSEGSGLVLSHKGERLPLPASLGYQHH